MANNRNHFYEDIWSSDESDDDDYNYLNALDNINWNSQRSVSSVSNTSRPPDRRNVAKNGSKPASRVAINPTARPAVAVKVRSNRNDVLLKDMMAAEKDKTKDMPKNETNNENKKRDLNLMEANEDIDDIVITNDNELKSNNRNDNKSDNSDLPKKRQKVEQITESEYNIKEVLNQKKVNHEKSVSNNNQNGSKSALNRVKGDRVFGKAFSPTVYSPEVAVMSKAPQISNIQVIQKALTFNEDTNSADESKYSPNRILSIILDWNTKWLQECSPSEVPNILSPFGEGTGLKTCYDSLEEYQSAYIPLILFETWAQVLKDFSNEKHFEFDAIRGPEVNSDANFLKINLQTVVPKNRVHLFPSEGYLILMELTVDFGATNEKRKLVLYGYITDFLSIKVTSSTSIPPGVGMPPSHNNPHLLKFFVVMSKRPIRFSQNQKVKVQSIHYLRPTMRQIDLISGLHSSPLFKDMLKPRLFTCKVVVPNNLSLSPNFNESQNRAIVGSSEALSRPYAVPKILFIQGPPGTGKTHTLVGIIKHIYLHWEKEDRLPRILICAPSNGAVDEISRRLYRERHFLAKHKVEKHRRALRCVRVGKESQISPDARQILFETLIKENSDNELKRLNAEKDKKSKEMERKMDKLDQEIANYRANKQTKELQRAETEAQTLMLEMAKFGPNSKEDSGKTNKSRLKLDIMVKADIVLSTLNSSHSSPIEKLYQRYGAKTFDCVIVDEASQCSEPELLMPLAYKMTKMILIGDPMQLPATIISKKASSLQLGRSLFERFFHYFRQCQIEDSTQESPILMLTEQYRMHPQICHFPSTHFYDGKLSSSTKVMKSREFKLKPYIVFDVTDSVENRSDPTNKYNELEANFVIRLLKLIDDMLQSVALNQKSVNPNERRKFSVGIITPYNGQKNFLNTKLNDKTYDNLNFEINTVDGFQGQERDIIVLSAVRAFDNHSSNKWQNIGFLDSVQRMNVALTRAKYSMILCISGRSLETNNNWKALIDDAIKRANCRFKVPSTLGDGKLKKMLAAIETISIAD